MQRKLLAAEKNGDQKTAADLKIKYFHHKKLNKEMLSNFYGQIS
jgi:hypothetical protein